MRIFHLSDLHLGKQLHLYSLTEDQRFIMRQIVDRAKEYRPDVIVLAGDIYDKSVPQAEAYQLFDTFLNALGEIEPMIPVLIIAGNHDNAQRLQFAGSFLEKHQIYIATQPPQSQEQKLKKVTIQDVFGEVDFYLLPFMKPGYVRHLFPEGQVTDYESAFRGILEREQIDYSRRNVLVAHQFFLSGENSPITCDSEQISLNVGGLEAIHTEVVKQFDYVALGHIHAPQTLAGNRVRYSGTPLKYSVSEEHHKKCITQVTLEGKDTEPKIETIALQPLRNVRRIKGTLEELLREEEIEQDYVSITLTDEREPYRPKDALAEIYQNILEIRMDNARTRMIHEELFDQSQMTDNRQSPLNLFREFYQVMQQQPLSMEEEAEVVAILEELEGVQA